MQKILLIEDDITYSRIIRNFLEKNNFQVQSANSISQAMPVIQSNWPNLIITDYRLPDGTGLELLEQSTKNNPEINVILITNYSDIRIAVKAMKMGAFEYITKPINPDELLVTVNESLKGAINSKSTPTNLESKEPDYVKGKSHNATKMEEFISLVAPTDLSVLILGETGTGKEYIAKKIHQNSNRRDKPFVAIDCGALSSELAGSELFGHIKGSFTGALDNKTGHFEQANGGTIFLDEVGNLGYEIQIKLLRAIEERKIRKIGANKETDIDVRIIAATNDELKSGSQDGNFREDLYHRLNEFTIDLQPLRNRKEDIKLFTSHFIHQSNLKLARNVSDIDAEVERIFMEYSWPGNLRELKNIVRRAVLLCKNKIITKDLLPQDLLEYKQESEPNVFDYKNNLVIQEKEMIDKVLKEVRFNKSKASQLLGMDRKTLYNKMEKYGLK
ncbi:sigma-54-dependent transcriptional regulator [Aquiflexum gelatinilyticum]|uniref:sigma-54-dependent transcriptional regulator n=1 Tax=Aquiflexum gelatinilyticum TaxID=2961943 RepID=UPI002168922C|nr:sigma-54 dependent transcriptional regulator [Aquiflexum gelatinilyticum]MCS4433594.1 sigma-54 dependent transcriptional regulator [Aquiflexum gelatinilyticum]